MGMPQAMAGTPQLRHENDNFLEPLVPGGGRQQDH
eukprot:CAMPEP_0174385982 /NCGR_PEP_ID=MMETSP0811_2-20130205/126971_1 /TAXON_ID=73025 ORGANISM="Eutreptiella gymnastica-like, Strain CCMP1594" /NCGR_SAMPLE_ID=MMETSP0811_2 /ASSEMBLY_ACC=CAM_ASM_000667 /LENGTH=34 /DNA_ID= /DNA_START= /DNA_END= /DNA_ORIENTATION=